MTESDEVHLEPGSRQARLYELFSLDLWWSLAMMAVGLGCAAGLFAFIQGDALRVAGLAVGAAGVLTFSVRLVYLRGWSGSHLDEWGAIVASVAVLIACTETVHAILSVL